MNGSWPRGGRNPIFSFSFPWVWILFWFVFLGGVWTWSASSVFCWCVWEAAKFAISVGSGFCDCCSGTDCELVIKCEKIVLCIICFAYPLSILVLLVLVFICCLIKLSLSQQTSFPVCPLSSPSSCGGGDGWASGCRVPSCWLGQTLA